MKMTVFVGIDMEDSHNTVYVIERGTMRKIRILIESSEQVQAVRELRRATGMHLKHAIDIMRFMKDGASVMETMK